MKKNIGLNDESEEIMVGRNFFLEKFKNIKHLHILLGKFQYVYFQICTVQFPNQQGSGGLEYRALLTQTKMQFKMEALIEIKKGYYIIKKTNP